MALFPPPARTELADTYPAPSNALARTGFGKLWDFVTSLLGATGAKQDMLVAAKILDPQALYNISLVPSVNANALTMKLTSGDGATAFSTSNAGTVAQRSATAAAGTYNVRNITSDISTVISSGSTAGHLSATASYLYWYLIDNAGTQELAWSSKWFGASGIVSSTAEGGAGAADSATVMYSTTVRSNLPFRFVGRSTDTQTTAGLWAALPTLTEMSTMDTSPDIVGAAVASAATINLTNVVGNSCHITGTVGISAVTLAAGKICTVIFDAALTLTHHTSNNNLPGAANITTSPNDRAIYWSDGTTTYCVDYVKASGAPVLMSPITASLGADVLLNNTANFFDGPSVAQGSLGTWFVSGQVNFTDTGASTDFYFKLWDGTTTIATCYGRNVSAAFVSQAFLCGFISAPAGNLRISAKDAGTVNGKLVYNTSGQSKDCTITAIRIG